jgi:uncharacterized protein (DUF885 family)
MMKFKLNLLLLILVIENGCQLQEQESPASAPSTSAFAAFVDDYFSGLFDWNPTQGTAAGLHQYDSKLEDLSSGTIAQRIQTLKGLCGRLEALRAQKLTQDELIDAEILDGQIRSELQDLEVLQRWQKNPMLYVGLPGSAVDGLIKRDFAPPDRAFEIRHFSAQGHTQVTRGNAS